MTNWLTRDVTPDEERAIAAFMTRLADAPVPGSTVLAARDAVWWKAQLLRRWDEQRRAARPLAVVEPLQIAASLLVAALAFLWALPSLGRVLTLVMASVARIA